MPRQRKYLYVPYEERQEAKNLGAIWDAKEKKFFAPYYLDQNIFAKWNKEQSAKNQSSYQKIDHNEVIMQFKLALEARRFIIDIPIMNGKIQRCKVSGDKGNEKSGAYIGFLDGYPAGFIQNHKTGYKENWKFQLSKQYITINEQKRPLNTQKNFTSIKVDKEQELLNLQRKTALRLEKEWNEAKKLENLHPYLIKKGFNKTFNLKVDRFQNLLIPFKDETDKFWSLQRISENGDKIIGVIKTKEEKEKGIEYSAKKKGCFYTQISPKEQDEFLICEGFATAMTIQKIF